MQNPSGLYPGDNWQIASDCDQLGASYSQTAVKTGPWALAFTSRNFAGTTTCGSASAVRPGLVPGKTYKLIGWWNAQGSVPRALSASGDGGLGTLGTIVGVTAGLSIWQGFAFTFVARQATHIFTLSQPPGASAMAFTRYVDDVAVLEVIQGVTATPESLAPTAAGESLAPSAAAEPDAPLGPPGYGG